MLLHNLCQQFQSLRYVSVYGYTVDVFQWCLVTNFGCGNDYNNEGTVA